jgi:hypothetical protein
MHRRGLAILSVVVCAAAVCGCGTASKGERGAAARAVDLRLVHGADASRLHESAALITSRLRRLGVTASTTVRAGAIRVESSAGVDPFALEAAARADPVLVRPVTHAEAPPCRASPRGSPAAAQTTTLAAPTLGGFCLTLAAGISLGTGIDQATTVARPSLGWTVSVELTSPGLRQLAAKLAALSGRDVAIVAGGDVISRFIWSAATPSLRNRIEGDLSEWEARRLAAALVVGEGLPSRLVVPRPPVLLGPAANVDVWAAALGVDICGRWLPNAPSFSHGPSANAGLHSHGDGLLSVHPFTDTEADAHATLGRFFSEGGWKLGPHLIGAWDGRTHRDGERCPDGRIAKVGYTVGGVEQRGDPSALRLENRMVIAIAFVPSSARIGAPHQALLLRQPRMGPSSTP